jgi:hypothetical protein
METKLKSITKNLQWSLVIRGAIVAGLWLAFSSPWAALAAFAYFYTQTNDHALRLLGLVAGLSVFLITPHEVFFGIVLFVATTLLLGLKESVLLHRVQYIEMIATAIFLVISKNLFETSIQSGEGFATGVLAISLITFYCYVLSLVIHEQTAVGEKKQRNGLMWRGVTVGLATVVAAETVVAIALLPVSSNQKNDHCNISTFFFH